ncbi:MAG TPA: type II toxin-antitoxin system RelE/ParE family toxin [Rhizomicrobium sp.]|jgi:phage-related protein|nr:type II toxin-antitoxin system RelE/ParE family toxin [Rhizomicrobium sp.]
MLAKKITAAFFATGGGAEPVREWLRAMPREDRKKIGDDVKAVEFGWPIGMPVCRPLGKGLYEVRTHLKDVVARVLFTIEGDKMVLLHGFIKKSQTTPAADLALARGRLQTFRRR